MYSCLIQPLCLEYEETLKYANEERNAKEKENEDGGRPTE